MTTETKTQEQDKAGAERNGVGPTNTPEALQRLAEEAGEEIPRLRGILQVTAAEGELEIQKLEKEKAKYEDWKEGAKEDDSLSEQERAAELREYDKQILRVKEGLGATKGKYQARVDALREDLQGAEEKQRKARNKLERLRERGKERASE